MECFDLMAHLYHPPKAQEASVKKSEKEFKRQSLIRNSVKMSSAQDMTIANLNSINCSYLHKTHTRLEWSPFHHAWLPEDTWEVDE